MSFWIISGEKTMGYHDVGKRWRTYKRKFTVYPEADVVQDGKKLKKYIEETLEGESNGELDQYEITFIQEMRQ